MRDAIEMARQAGWEMDDSLVLEPEVIWYMSQGQLERLVAIVRADEREAIRDEWHSCVMSDLENGVKSLNEAASKKWHSEYPAQSKMFPEWLEARCGYE